MHHWCELGYSWNNFHLTPESFQRKETNWNCCKSVQLYHLCPPLWKAYLCANYIYNIRLKTWICQFCGTVMNHIFQSFLGFWVSWTEFRWWYAVFTFPEGSLIGSSDRRCLSCRVLMNQFKFFHPRNDFLNNLYDGFETFELNEGFQTLLTWNIPQADCYMTWNNLSLTTFYHIYISTAIRISTSNKL